MQELVTYIKHSEIQHNLNTTLKQSIEVRWDSKLSLLESIKDNYEILKSLAITNKCIDDHLIHIDYELLVNLIEILVPFHKYRIDLCFDTKTKVIEIL